MITYILHEEQKITELIYSLRIKEKLKNNLNMKLNKQELKLSINLYSKKTLNLRRNVEKVDLQQWNENTLDKLKSTKIGSLMT